MQSDLMSSIHPGVQQFYLRKFFTLCASNSFLFHLGGGPTCYLCWSGQLSSHPSWSNMACTIKVSKRHTILDERSTWMSELFWHVYRFYKMKTVCSALRNFFISHVVTGPDNSLVALPKTFPFSLYISIFNLFLFSSPTQPSFIPLDMKTYDIKHSRHKACPWSATVSFPAWP